MGAYEVKIMRYPLSVKEAVIQKVLSGKKRQVDIAKEAGIGRSTLSYWVREYKKKGPSALNFQEKRPKDWTASEKMEALIATGEMVEEERNRWCRTQGIFAHHLNQWKKEAICAFQKEPVKANDAELKRLKKENSALQREIARKDRALSETAALLVLKKRADSIWGENRDG